MLKYELMRLMICSLLFCSLVCLCYFKILNLKQLPFLQKHYYLFSPRAWDERRRRKKNRKCPSRIIIHASTRIGNSSHIFWVLFLLLLREYVTWQSIRQNQIVWFERKIISWNEIVVLYFTTMTNHHSGKHPQQQKRQKQQQQKQQHIGDNINNNNSNNNNRPQQAPGCLLESLPDDVIVRIGTSVAKLCGIQDLVFLSRASKRLKKILVDSQENLTEIIRVRTLGGVFHAAALVFAGNPHDTKH